ncbi:hypothetical protein Leryth_009432 [Lithospermum erythrorhizon]|nr:hypothetical protein Leryth_009432 [Lithospermum erythrorhizon]
MNMMEKVVLGMPGAWAEDEYQVADHYTSKIGGVPDWPIPNFDISPDLLECRECKSKLCLVAQIYAPISTGKLKIEERILYIFGCVKLSCGDVPQSWRVIRVQKHPSGAESKSNCQTTSPDSENKPKACSLTFDFEEVEDGSDYEIDLEELSRAFSEAATLTPHSKKCDEPEKHTYANSFPRQTRIIDKLLPVLPCFYLYMQEERITKEAPYMPVTKQYSPLKENETDDDQAQAETWEEEGYEYDKALNADRAYLKFMKRLDICPEQCFRYSYGGDPLMATGKAKESGGTCSICKGPRFYELQLMAPLIYFLQETTDDKQRSYVEHWNWITLIVYTCAESCIISSSQEKFDYEGWNVIEEAVVVQNE